MTTSSDARLQRALAALLCLPALVLALPFGPLAGLDFAVELTQTGWAALLLLPAAALAVFVRRGRAATLVLLLAYWLWTVWGGTLGGTESLERDRALILVACSAVAAIAGTGLQAPGRRTLASGLVAISLVTTAATVLIRLREGHWAGPLHNTGETACVLLPGALVGGWRAAREIGAARLSGALAFALALLVATAASSLTALAALALGLLAALLLAATPSRLVVGALAGTAAACFLVVAFARPGVPDDAPSAVEQSVGDASGLAVRLLVWDASLDLVRAAPIAGVGPGQFVARFPEVRDPEEIERSTHGRRTAETAVEHPHDDVLLALTEGGIVGGLLLAAFLAAALVRALVSLRRSRGGEDDTASPTTDDEQRAPLALAVLGVLLLGLTWYPLTYLAAAAIPAFAAMGALLAGAPPARTTLVRRALPALALVLLAGFAPRALTIVDHGRALARIDSLTDDELKAMEEAYSAGDITAVQKLVREKMGTWEATLDEAQEACPDSYPALALRATHLRVVGAPDGVQRDVWIRAQALRPNSFEALLSLGNVAQRLDDPHAAREWFTRALAVDPENPKALWNAALIAYRLDDLELASDVLTTLERTGRLERMKLVRLGADLLLAGRIRAGQHALGAADERFADLTGERAKELELEYRRQGEQIVGEGFETLAHVLWARDHAANGRFGDARRSLRQALRSPRIHHPPAGPTRLRMELAAAMYRSDREREARDEMLPLQPTPRDWLALPGWAGETLRAEGWMETEPR